MIGNRCEGSSGKPLYLHRDHLGSVIAITDDNAKEVGTYEYYPFGELTSSANKLGNFGFNGQEMDWDINLYHFPARYYEPQWGRFVTQDPWTGMPDDERNLVVQQYVLRTPSTYSAYPQIINLPISINKENPEVLNCYSYVANNPVKYIDPHGYFYRKPCWNWETCLEECKKSPELQSTSNLFKNISGIGAAADFIFGLTGAAGSLNTQVAPHVALKEIGKRLGDKAHRLPFWDFSPVKLGPFFTKIAPVVNVLGTISTIAWGSSVVGYVFTQHIPVYCYIACLMY